MKKILTLISLLAFVGVCAVLAENATPGKGPEQKHKFGQEMRKGPGEMGLGLYSKLNLTDEQKQKIIEIQKTRRSQMDALKEDTSLTPEQKRQKMKEIYETTQKQMDEVLTAEQKQQIEQLREQMREQMRKNWENRKKGDNKPSAQ